MPLQTKNTYVHIKQDPTTRKSLLQYSYMNVNIMIIFVATLSMPRICRSKSLHGLNDGWFNI